MNEAVKYNVLPLDSSFADRANPSLRPGFNTGRTDFTYVPGMIRIPEANAPDIKNKSYHIAADIEVPPGGAEGILATQGGRFGGWALLLLDGKPMFAYAYSNQDGAKFANQAKSKTRIAGADKLPPGHHTIAFDFTYDGGGIGKGGQGTLSVDGKKVAEGRIDKTLPFRFSLDESFDIGRDTGTPVIDEYDAKMPFKFTGTLRKVDFKLGPDTLTDDQRAALEVLRRKLALANQ
jgi:arylsulfatase